MRGVTLPPIRAGIDPRGPTERRYWRVSILRRAVARVQFQPSAGFLLDRKHVNYR